MGWGCLRGQRYFIGRGQRRHVPNRIAEQGGIVIVNGRVRLARSASRGSIARLDCRLLSRRFIRKFSIYGCSIAAHLTYANASRYFSASSAAMQPVPALVTACR